MALNDRDQGGSTTSSTIIYTAGPANGVSAGPRPDAAHEGGPVRDATTQELVGRLVNDFSELVDKQIELAKQELRDDIGDVIGAVKTLAIGAGIAAAAGLLLIIWAWTAFIWFFNWLGNRFWDPWGGVLGWILGLIVPAILAYLVAYRMFIKSGLRKIMAKIKNKPLVLTRATLKENVEWLKSLKTRSVR